MNGLTTKQTAEHIDDWVFSEKWRRIMKRKLVDGISYEVIAEQEQMSVNGIKNGVKRWRTE